MAEHATPVTRPALVVVSAVSGADSGNTAPPAAAGPVTQAGNRGARVTGPAAGNAVAVTAFPETAGGAVPMTLPQRGRHAVSHWAGTVAEIAREAWAPCGRTIHSIWQPEPETMAEHRAYVRSMAWVPPELAGKAATVIKWAGIFYHILIGHPLIAAMEAAIKTAKNIQVAASRPLRLLMLAAFVSVLALILLNL